MGEQEESKEGVFVKLKQQPVPLNASGAKERNETIFLFYFKSALSYKH